MSISDPVSGGGRHPLLADILDCRRKWQQPKEKREPYTAEMFAFLFLKICRNAKMDKSFLLGLEAAVFDWTRLGCFTGSRANEYAQTTARRNDYSRVPNLPDAGEWAGMPLAFVDIDFTFYTKDSIRIPLAELRLRQAEVYELHVRFRYDKSQQNFTIRKFRRSGHHYLCPVLAAISIILRAQILHKRPEIEPLGVFRIDRKGSYTYLMSRDIIKIMRSAVVGAYPNANHFLRLNTDRIVAHSNRVTAAVALSNAGMDIDAIAFRLRWSPPSVSHYLRECSSAIDKITQNTLVGAMIT